MKFATKFLMAGAVAALAVMISMAPSEAAKKKHAAMSKSCSSGPMFCSTNCANGWCSMYICGGDGKYTPAVLTPVCAQGLCQIQGHMSLPHRGGAHQHGNFGSSHSSTPGAPEALARPLRSPRSTPWC